MDTLDLSRPPLERADRCWTIVLPRPCGTDRSLRPEAMNAPEQMFFFGAPLAHIVEYEEHLREVRREQAARRLARSRGPHDFTRQLPVPGAAPAEECSDRLGGR